jgi:putative aldouronate transport system permease protein
MGVIILKAEIGRTLPIRRRNRLLKVLRTKYDLYLLMIIPLLWYAVFKYYPIYGLQIAFRDFVPRLGVWGSEWVGLRYFKQFFSSYYFWTLIRNTITLNLYYLIVGFPIPIFLALVINEIGNTKFKKIVQNVTYIPHFLSVVVIVGMMNIFLDPQMGILNKIVMSLGGQAVDYMRKPEWFKHLYVFSGIWQHMGWNSIIYIAALAGVDPELYEAATIDGCSKLQKIKFISIPSILPTIIILFILQIGSLMDVGFEKILLMKNPVNAEVSEVISTFVYQNGIQKGQFSYTTAVGLFNAIINFAILVFANKLTKRITNVGLW